MKLSKVKNWSLSGENIERVEYRDYWGNNFFFGIQTIALLNIYPFVKSSALKKIDFYL